jgi:hypothetical protein
MRGGSFAFVGADTVYNGLAAIRSDGTVDPAFNPDIRTAIAANGDIDPPHLYALAVSPDGATIYAGGASHATTGRAAAAVPAGAARLSG